jgi:hypothetical protein
LAELSCRIKELSGLFTSSSLGKEIVIFTFGLFWYDRGGFGLQMELFYDRIGGTSIHGSEEGLNLNFSLDFWGVYFQRLKTH